MARAVVGQFDKEASQTRDYCVAKNATQRAARPDPSLRKKRLFRMTIKLTHYLEPGRLQVRVTLLLYESHTDHTSYGRTSFMAEGNVAADRDSDGAAGARTTGKCQVQHGEAAIHAAFGSDQRRPS